MSNTATGQQAKRKKVPYRPSPVGDVIHGWINKPDTKFNEDGVFKVDLGLRGKEAEDFKGDLARQAQEYFDEQTAEMTPGERKKWSVYVPFVDLEDDNGNPTGVTEVHFRQNATIRIKDGDPKKVTIGIYDAEENDLDAPIFSGSKVRVMYAPRGIKMVSTKQLGIRLDFSMVQVAELAKGSGGGSKFGKIEGGYTGGGKAAKGNDLPEDSGEADTDAGGDY